MDEQHQYDKVCQPNFKELFDKLDEMNTKLFEDNGHKSVQTKINENALWCSVIKWFTITISCSMIMSLMGLIVWLIKMRAER